jgi:hypothetical protein
MRDAIGEEIEREIQGLASVRVTFHEKFVSRALNPLQTA